MNLSDITFIIKSFRKSPCGECLASYCCVSLIILAAMFIYGFIWSLWFVLFYFVYDTSLATQIVLSGLIVIPTVGVTILGSALIERICECIIAECKDIRIAIRETKEKIKTDLETRNNNQDDLNNLGGANDVELGL